MEISDIVENVFENCAKMQKKKFKKGTVITNYMEKRKQICILIAGTADLIRYDLNGNKDIIENYDKNDIFGEAFYPVNTNNELFVLATSDCEVLLFLYDDIKLKCRNNCKIHSALTSSLLDLVLNNAVHQNTRIEILSKRTIREKLLSYFSILSTKSFSRNITLPFSLTNLADYLSVDRSAMMREIKSLINEGFIIKNGNKIKLLY
jgi:CRP-like cAMP-binding protein